MAGIGIDLPYVVTGAHAAESEGTLSPEERSLLLAWRDGSVKARAALTAVAELTKTEKS
ncbi:hypothetical protein D3C85_1781170 [compost metagenome]